MRPITQIIVHCSASGFGDASLIERWHKGRGFHGIGYHFVILNGFVRSGAKYNADVDGAIQTGRPVARVGAHCRGHNSHSIGICLIGDRLFTASQLYDSLPRLLVELMKAYALTTEDIHGHTEFNPHKSCPNINVDLIRATTRLVEIGRQTRAPLVYGR